MDLFYLFIDYQSALTIVSTKLFQSTEYEYGNKLSEFIRNQGSEKFIFDKLTFEKYKKGLLIRSCDSLGIDKAIIFDLKEFEGFKESSQTALTILQKTLRLAIRLWDNIPLGKCERNINNTTVYAIFPYGPTNNYKILLEKNPDKKKRDSRTGDYFLAFKSGNEVFDIDDISFTQFRKALKESKEKVLDTKEVCLDTEPKNNTLNVTQIGMDDSNHSIKSLFLGFDNWERYLTKNQKDFIFNDSVGPERLEGAAGTGKTIALILKCIFRIKQAKQDKQKLWILFITHSLATKNSVSEIFQANYPEIENYLKKHDEDKYNEDIYLKITTLQEHCIDLLGQSIEPTEYLDKDAQESKELQILYLFETFDEAMSKHYETYKELLSEKFIRFIENTDTNVILELLQHEIAVIIKGRAQEDFDKYKTLKRPVYGLPIEKEGDLSFIFFLFEEYQNKLRSVNQYDSDDIILSSIGQLNTPIWRRRRSREGFDVIFVDETHLFNLNELSIFHYLNKEAHKTNIIYTIDKSQAIGDRGLSDDLLKESFDFNDEGNESKTKFNTVFRSSPEIIDVAFSVLSSGATLFLNFENPLEKSNNSFTESEERKAQRPEYISFPDEEQMIQNSFVIAEELTKKLKCVKSEILIVTTTADLLSKIESFSKRQNKPVEILKDRGDFKVIRKAISQNRYVIGGIDYVGGLEFEGVIIVGVDKGRVPPLNSASNSEGYHFMSYASHNRLYVAITRAKYAVLFLGEVSRGMSELLKDAEEKRFIDIK